MNQTKASKDIRLWLLILLCTAIVAGIGLVIFLAAAPAGDGQTAGDFFAKLIENPWLTAAALLLILAGIAGLTVLAKKNPSEQLSRKGWATKEIVTGALCIGLSFVLSCIKVYEMPYGGAITPASMLPIIIFAYIYGMPKGLIVCVAYGILQMLQGVYYIDPLQFALDYILAFAAMSVAGLFKKNLVLAIVAACLARFIFAFVAGFYWIPEGADPVPYSLIYNISYIGPEGVICVLISLIPGVHKNVDRLRDAAAAARRPAAPAQ